MVCALYLNKDVFKEEFKKSCSIILFKAIKKKEANIGKLILLNLDDGYVGFVILFSLPLCIFTIFLSKKSRVVVLV